MSYRFHHLHLICSNLDNTESFFTKMLGAKVIERRKFGTAKGLILDLNGIAISLRGVREDDNIVGDCSQRRFGYDHLGLEVDDIDVAYRELKQAGFRFTIPPKNVESARIAFLEGPDNITIELFQPLV